MTFFSANEVKDKLFEMSDDEDNLSEILSSGEESDDDDIFAPSTAEELVVQNEEPPEKRQRRPPISHGINSIDAALDHENYEKVIMCNNLSKNFTCTIEKPTASTSGTTIEWTSEQHLSIGRQDESNIITGPIGVRGEAQNSTTPREAWECFFTANILTYIVEMTNKKIQTVRSQFSNSILNDSRNSFIGLTNCGEILAFIGLLYLRGLLGLSGHDVSVLFGKLTGSPIFGATMSKNRFKFLFSHLTFDDPSTRSQRWQFDRFSAFRQVFELFNYNCSKNLVPDDFMSLDETLYPTRGQVAFKQFNPSKPAKYGLLFKSINACRYPYTFISCVYSGKPHQHESPLCNYYVRGTEETVKRMVNSLMRYTNLAGRNLTFDRLYTSITLARWLYEKNITCIGTIQSNRKGIPNEIKEVKDREPNSYEMLWEKSEKMLNLHSFVTKTKSSGKKNILLLSTMKPIMGVVKNDAKKKPAIFKLYDFTKGGTDIIDQRMGFYSCKGKSRRWTMAVFSYVLDTCRVNSSTVCALNKHQNPRKLISFDFGMELVMALVKPHIELRSLHGLSNEIQLKIKAVLPDVETNRTDMSNAGDFPLRSNDRKRCRKCLEETRGPGAKNAKNKLGKTRFQCQNCGNATCERHSFRRCCDCS